MRFPFFLSVAMLLAALPVAAADAKQPVDWVNPHIDTVKPRWFYFNSASRPFGMVNLSPDTKTKGDWDAGYRYKDDTIECFSHIHCWQLAGLPVMPVTGAPSSTAMPRNFPTTGKSSNPATTRFSCKPTASPPN